jgi:hypothetical protein
MSIAVRLATVFIAASSLAISAESKSDDFQLQCNSTPFAAPNAPTEIDRSCGQFGSEDTDRNGPKAVQNSVKNSLCRSGPTTTLQQEDFVTLQNEAKQRHIPFGASFTGGIRVEHLPQDRSALASMMTVGNQEIGEGSIVQIIAIMDWPHYADTREGESVNCKIPGTDTNDIHINLVQTPAPPQPARNDPDRDQRTADRNAALCGSITAEIIPHFRPPAWEVSNLQEIERQHLPVRIAGQLFFDASHRPCTGTVAHDSLRRASLWEIHPVYSIDVCSRGSIPDCPADDASVWLPLHEWITRNPVNAPVNVDSAIDAEPE